MARARGDPRRLRRTPRRGDRGGLPRRGADLRLLLDARAFLWWNAGAGLSGEAERAVEAVANEVWVSAATVWEIAIKRERGRLDAPADLATEIEENSFLALPVRVEHAERAAALPPVHSDPFDRLLVAQAQVEGLTIVTRDPDIARYAVAVLPA